jgi:hypothetical protein
MMDYFVRALWGAAAIVIAFGAAWIAADRWSVYETASARHNLDIRVSELTQRALTPGSHLACLDAVGSAAVETACEKALFANPETVAASIAYVDAKLNLLADSRPWDSRRPVCRCRADTISRHRPRSRR